MPEDSSITYSIVNNDRELSGSGFTRDDVADFLYTHLDEFGDPRDHILNAISYAMGDGPGQDGFILIAHEEGAVLGAVVMNNTNMKGYIPEYILVYIAVHGEARGRGLGKGLMQHIVESTDGSIALHVEPDNPARHLYDKIGFTNKYLEMRYQK